MNWRNFGIGFFVTFCGYVAVFQSRVLMALIAAFLNAVVIPVLPLVAVPLGIYWGFRYMFGGGGRRGGGRGGGR